MTSFWGEIKRRKVFRVAVVYAVVAWLIVQVVGSIKEPLNLPEWFDTFVIVLLAIGFPMALVLAWIFDITPQGIRATDDADNRDQSASAAAPAAGQTFSYVSQALVLLAVAFLVLNQYLLDDAVSGGNIEPDTFLDDNVIALQVSRYSLTPPEPYQLANDPGYDVEIAPDGSRLVILAQDLVSGRRSLFLRELDQLEPRLIADADLLGSTGSINPFFSPDGQSIGFLAPGIGIVRMPVSGGTARTIASMTGINYGGATWGSSGDVVYSSVAALHRVAAGGGGAPEQLTPEPESGSGALYLAPSFLPDERGVLVGMLVGEEDSIAVLDLQTREIRTLVSGGAENPRYLPSGHIVYGLRGSLMAVPFDLNELALSGDPVTVHDGMRDYGPGGAADFAVSLSGTLAYVPNAGAGGATLNNVNWVDRDGEIVAAALNEPVRGPTSPRLSPDGSRLVLTTGRGGLGTGIQVYGLDGRPPIPLVIASTNFLPVWNPGGTEIAFSSNRERGAFALYSTRADGSQLVPELLSSEQPAGGSYSWSLNDELIVGRNMGDTRVDLYTITPGGGGMYEPLLITDSSESEAVLSPSNRWLAYVSDRTGQDEVWVMPYPDGVPVRVSANGGIEPRWAADESELFYLQGDTMMAVPIEAAEDLSFGPAQSLFSGGFWFSDLDGAVSYDVAPDGRFLMIGPEITAEDGGSVNNVVVVENWITELQQLTSRD